jgi:DNA-binding transcriptional regulator YhcF (GntR family)
MENNDNFAISHKNLATIVGAHRVSITNVIAELKEAGIVETQYGKIIIKDKIALKELVFQNL